MMPYAAYLRIYEPLSAFVEPERSRWAAYAAPAQRGKRMNALAQERIAELRRVAAVPPVLIPERESEHAHVRWLEGLTYVCPWQTSLRSILALAEMRACEEMSPLASAPSPDEAIAALAGLGEGGLTAKVYIKSANWSVPITWFVPFVPTDLIRGEEPRPGAAAELPEGPGAPRGGVPPGMTVPVGVYATTMSLARQRVRRAVAVLRGAIRQLPSPGHGGRGMVVREALATEADLGGLGRWMNEFHPYSLIELDYGGLGRLLGGGALRCDESVAEVAAAIEALARSEWEVALAMYQRTRSRWRTPHALSSAN
jgi:hypothetical protein